MDQHMKTLGQVAYEQACGDCEEWSTLDDELQSDWEAIANVVASEVIFRTEEGLKLL